VKLGKYPCGTSRIREAYQVADKVVPLSLIFHFALWHHMIFGTAADHVEGGVRMIAGVHLKLVRFIGRVRQVLQSASARGSHRRLS
jgi:hypothetical protein